MDGPPLPDINRGLAWDTEENVEWILDQVALVVQTKITALEARIAAQQAEIEILKQPRKVRAAHFTKCEQCGGPGYCKGLCSRCYNAQKRAERRAAIAAAEARDKSLDGSSQAA
jgi:hypothetical protein